MYTIVQFSQEGEICTVEESQLAEARDLFGFILSLTHSLRYSGIELKFMVTYYLIRTCSTLSVIILIKYYALKSKVVCYILSFMNCIKFYFTQDILYRIVIIVNELLKINNLKDQNPTTKFYWQKMIKLCIKIFVPVYWYSYLIKLIFLVNTSHLKSLLK